MHVAQPATRGDAHGQRDHVSRDPWTVFRIVQMVSSCVSHSPRIVYARGCVRVLCGAWGLAGSQPVHVGEAGDSFSMVHA